MSELELENLEVEQISSTDIKDQVLQLTERINTLAEGGQGKIEDVAVAQETAQTIKPYVDRLISLNRLLHPVGRIVEKRQQIQDLQDELDEDVAEIEDIADDIDTDVAPVIVNDLQGEIAAVKRDRKLVVLELAPDDSPASDDSSAADDAPEPHDASVAHDALAFDDSSAADGSPVAESTPETSDTKGGKSRLLDLPIEERFERILAERFVSLARVESIIGIKFAANDKKRYLLSLEKMWDQLFDRDEFRTHVQKNRATSLANAFADYALVFRSPTIKNKDRTTLASLREQFQSFFVNANAKGLWYTRQAFFHKPIERGHWALLDKQYLNCTFKKPSIRLLMYARANGLSAQCVRQKSVVEDIYDRIVIELALRERFFENCHSITRTSYQASADEPAKQVYLFYKEDSIRISGKSGTPHWKPTKPRWPGVLPSIVFAPQS